MKVIGKIIGGEGRAARLGFPTFNIELPKGIEAGVYGSSVHYIGSTYMAVIFADKRRNILEAHLLNFDTSKREREIEVEVLDKIRGAMNFPHDGELIEQIQKDVEEVRKL